MNKFAKWFLVPMLCFAANFASAANIKDYPTVAVMEFGNKAITSRGLRGHDMAMATEYAIYQLSACGWFDLVDYEQLSTIAKMHAINMSGLVDQGTAVQMGKFAGAQFMVIGNVTGLTAKENIAGVRAHNAKVGNAQHVVNANVTVRIVDIETGRIVAAGIGKGSSTSTMTEIGFTKYRNRKVETENIYKSVATNVVDEYKKNTISSADSGSSSSTSEDSASMNSNSSDTRKLRDNSVKNYGENQNFRMDADRNKTTTNYGYGVNTTTGTSKNNTYENLPVQKQTIKGDIDGDGFIDEEDLELLQIYLVGLKPEKQIVKANTDLNGDGKVSITDLAQLKLGLLDIQNSGKKKLGDVNEDNIVDKNDANMLAEYLVKLKPEGFFEEAADINRDGTISSTDASQLALMIKNGETKYFEYWMAPNDLGKKFIEYNKNSGKAPENEMVLTKTEDGTINSVDTNRHYDRGTLKDNIDINGQSKKSGYEYSNRDLEDVRQKNSNYDAVETSKQANEYQNNSAYTNENVNVANNIDTFQSSNKNIYTVREAENYSIVIGTAVVSDVQVRNAISKAVRDAIYGKTGLMTTLNNGKQLKIKTGF